MQEGKPILTEEVRNNKEGQRGSKNSQKANMQGNLD